jgi:aspartate kinase
MAIIVQKFGGTSLANAEMIRAAAGRTIEAVKKGYQVVVVASARGKQTDQLVADALELNPDPSPREMDQLLHTGEIQTVALYAMALDQMGYDAISLTGYQIRMVTDNNHSKARIKSIDADRMYKYINRGKIVLIAGFQGIDDEEHVTTLGRGGSDTTAVAIAAVLDADVCEIYTDVDGIHTADPRIFEDAAKIDQISYDEMLEMASLGAGVMHGRSIEFGKNYNVKIHVRSSSEDKEGTIITHEVPQMEDIVVSGATIQKDLAKVSIIGVDNKPGNAARIFSALANAKVVISDIIQTEISNDKANLSFTTSDSDLKDAEKAIDSMKKDLNFDNIFVRDDIVEISIVGVGMRTHYGVADKMFSALAKEKINIDSITTSEICISCIVDEDQGRKALIAICRAFDLDKPAEKRITKG